VSLMTMDGRTPWHSIKYRLVATIGLVVMPAWMASAEQVTKAVTQIESTKAGRPPDHIVVIVEENHGYSQIIGNRDAAYINSLAAAGTLFTNYHGVGHPSAPNYFALFSGSAQGVTEDGTYFFPKTPTLAGELQQAGSSFVGYAEPPIDRDHTPLVELWRLARRESGI